MQRRRGGIRAKICMSPKGEKKEEEEDMKISIFIQSILIGDI